MSARNGASTHDTRISRTVRAAQTARYRVDNPLADSYTRRFLPLSGAISGETTYARQKSPC